MKIGKFTDKIAALLLVLLMVGACHNSHVAPGSAPVYYTDSHSVRLLPTSAMTESIDMPQHLKGEFSKPDGTKDSFDADTWVRANDSVLTILLFSGFGNTIGEITYAKDSVYFQSSLMNVERFKAEYILADFQICFYPFEVLKENFERAGFHFSQIQGSQGSLDFERHLTYGKQLILKATRSGTEIELSNELRGYRYHIILGEIH